MKRPAWITFSASLVITSLLLGLGALALADTDIVLGRYPNAFPHSLSVQRVQDRLFRQNSTFETGDPPNVVAGWYAGRYHLEPDYDPVIQGQCVRLTGANGVSGFRQTVVVSMCVLEGVTRVYFDRSVSVGQ